MKVRVGFVLVGACIAASAPGLVEARPPSACARVVHLDEARTAFVEHDLCTDASKTLHRLPEDTELLDWTVLEGGHLLYLVAVDDRTARVVVWHATDDREIAWPDVTLRDVQRPEAWLPKPVREDRLGLQVDDDRTVRVVALADLEEPDMDWQAVDDQDDAIALSDFELLGVGWPTRTIVAPDELGLTLRQLDEALEPLADRAEACSRDDVVLDETGEHDRVLVRAPEGDRDEAPRVLAESPERDSDGYIYTAIDLLAPCEPHVTVLAVYERGSMCWSGTISVFDTDIEPVLSYESSTCERNSPVLPSTDDRYLVQRGSAHDGWVVHLQSGKPVHQGTRDFVFVPGT